MQTNIYTIITRNYIDMNNYLNLLEKTKEIKAIFYYKVHEFLI